MEQTRQLVVGRIVKVTELFVTNSGLNRQAIGDVSFNIDVEGGVVLLRRRIVGETTKAVGAG